MTSHVLLLHGLYMGTWIMQPLAHKLKKHGFTVDTFGYYSIRQTLPQHAVSLTEKVEQFYRCHNEPLHFVGHSLGGLVLRHFAAMHPDLIRGRIVTLGTPHQGSSVAERLKNMKFSRFTLGGSYRNGLDGNVPALPPGIELGSLAGNRPIGAGNLLGIKGENDGTVCVKETFCEGMKDHIVLPVTHTSMLLNKDAAAQIEKFLHCGYFLP
ncbi:MULTISPECIES: triacylglycerol lipase [unclassified Neisseria]|uniref:esterase/lipase family protein n=1 Tax=unclassified Neisseria TaxID=2623750 RepID=UPI002666D382|nr:MULTISPECIES: alpha/beta fold hydrolase [unclassified Neisseria]MDO1509151.1 alpha/beta fold hydrolase [Neisseria sp. MVDL19-042950]MDO1515570.1 alpha/beta fold hydrolase [Neisseria sp. MVDL18-041461]MDO1562929.1 alpha/beta fold hydrolase [Neisseria sp. MVDL20-010259]